ncbi:putative M22 peptidase homolog HI_0388 [Simkania negevensis Z]|uniref:Putative M22 peptidase homolog HI_0388 n=1 Tax=Simkania negevensis (strain ATCC VR-1471 / DSM 27360 / Z) TaxID=331113 RepID=F8L5P0_SIMNZ|nr:putative M22 peptidase homolog HI_0388 [Simkania negevensis Z]
MKFLVIETSGDKNFVLLSNGNKLTQEALPTREQRDHLLPAIDRLLENSELELSDLDFIAVGNGPGSFTGTRIGVLTAKTLSFAKKLPLIPFCSFLAFMPLEKVPFFLLVDAKSHGYYVYDGEKVQLQKKDSTEIPTNIPLYSPHPTLMHVETKKADLNLPFLLNHLEQAFAAGEVSFHDTVKVSYLVYQ